MANTMRGMVFAVIATVTVVGAVVCLAQDTVPEWCRALPRPEYRTLERVQVSDAWFEVYRVAPATFAVYEPHQSEETISYLILGTKRAILFDTGLGIGDIKKVTAEVTKLPITVLNSHTHNDHVGGNWQFDSVYSVDTDFSRAKARGSAEDAKAEIAPGEVCGTLPAGFDARAYATRPWKIAGYVHGGEKLDLGGRTLEVISTPGHTPDSISLIDRANGLLFTGDTYYPATIWLYRPETDLSAYQASLQKLIDLAPRVKVVLGAHNIPTAKPEALKGLLVAFQKVRDRKVAPQATAPGQVVYRVDGYAFRMKAP